MGRVWQCFADLVGWFDAWRKRGRKPMPVSSTWVRSIQAQPSSKAGLYGSAEKKVSTTTRHCCSCPMPCLYVISFAARLDSQLRNWDCQNFTIKWVVWVSMSAAQVGHREHHSWCRQIYFYVFYKVAPASGPLTCDMFCVVLKPKSLAGGNEHAPWSVQKILCGHTLILAQQIL